MPRNHKTAQRIQIRQPGYARRASGLARAASMRHAGAMKHRLQPKGGAVNDEQSYLDEYSLETDYAIEDSCTECDGPGGELRFPGEDGQPIPGYSVHFCDACFIEEEKRRGRAEAGEGRNIIRLIVDEVCTLINE